MSQPYVLDSNFFLQASKMHYPIDIAPGFWEKVSQLAADGKIISIDKVKAELFTNPDSLTQWIDDNLPADFFKETDTQIVLTTYGHVCAWAASRSAHYSPGALATFLEADEADAWLVCYAAAHQLTIVTHEVSNPARKSSIKIPDACQPFNVPYLTTIEMFRALGETF